MTNEKPNLEYYQDQFFTKKMIFDSRRVLESQTISFSFTKGDIGSFFTASGLVGNQHPYETRITFKASNSTFSSSCTCLSWTPEHHCEHAAALLAKFYKLKTTEAQKEEKELNPHFSFMGVGVVCSEYGTVIESAAKLKGALPSSAFYSLQYRLINNKIVNLDTAKPFEHKIVLKIQKIPVAALDAVEHFSEFYYKPRFELFVGETKISEISIFDNLYLFNWNSGEIFDLPTNFKNWIKRLKIAGYAMTANEYIRSTNDLRKEGYLKLEIEGTFYDDIPLEELHSRISITKSIKKNHMSFCYEFYIEKNEQLIKLPDYFKIFTFENGLLESFRVKLEAYEFLRCFLNPEDEQFNQYKKYLRYSSERERITEITDCYEKNEYLEFYDESQHLRIRAQVQFLKNLFRSSLVSFTDVFFKFSQNSLTERKLYFDVPKTTLMTGISQFYNGLAVLGISLFYNKQEVKNWRSRIKFERKKSQVNWFELNINMSSEDMDVIAQAEINEDFAITQDGLVIFSDEQKDLIKMMKKYTLYEGKDVQINPTDLSRQFSISFNRARIFELFELRKLGIEGALTEEELAFCDQLLNLTEIPNYEIPEKAVGIIRPYQETGYRWLRFLFENNLGACLADDMGLGKTLQTIIFLESIIHRVNKVLIVCPVSIILNWQNEILKFSNLKVDVFYGDSREIKSDAKIILTSYGLMKKEAFEELSKIEFDILILDEVQNLKNIRSLGANAARQLKAKFRICLTGTPVENDLAEFYNIIDLSIPGVWGDLQFVKTSSSKKSRLIAKKMVRPFVLRRTKAQVLSDLPEKEENHVFLEFSEEEKNQYAAHLINIRNRLSLTSTQKKYGEILKGLLELRQLCLWQRQQGLMSTKIDFLMENLELILGEGHKVIIFSQFTTYLDIIQDRVIHQGWNYARIDGSQTLKTRQDMVEKFQNGNATVFLISLKAGGVGLNLTAASYIFLMDPWWNPAVESQAIDRAHRIGQKNKLTVYRPIIKNSVEEKVLLLQQSKRELFNDLMNVDDESTFSGKLSMEDFQSLLS